MGTTPSHHATDNHNDTSDTSAAPAPRPSPPAAGSRRHREDWTVKAVSLLLVSLVIILTVAHGDTAASVISSFRTAVTNGFTWYFVVLATLALLFCVYMATGRRGAIVLGGRGARPEYGRFAWYSMLFACGQGIGLIFWSVAEPLLLRSDNPLSDVVGTDDTDGALIWTYFHWAVHGWAIYCVVALCLALSFHNRGSAMTFRDAVTDMFPERARSVAGVVVETIVILATVFGLSTSFAFAAMQLSSGIGQTFGTVPGPAVRTVVVVAIGLLAALSVYLGVEKGMRRVSEVNSVLSVVLMAGVLVAGPTVYLLSVLPQTTGQYLWSMWWMGTWTDAASAATTLESWDSSWNGTWTVFIWCWCWAFSTFVGSFIARISRGRSLREFVVGVLGVPSLVCVVWIGLLGGAALYYDDAGQGAVSRATQQDTSLGLFVMLGEIPHRPVALALLLIATTLVGTYYLTSLDSGIHALSGFVSSTAQPSRLFRVALVAGIAGIAFLLLTIGGETVVGTVQTGTIIGALPYTVVALLMMANTFRHTSRETPAGQKLGEET